MLNSIEYKNSRILPDIILINHLVDKNYASYGNKYFIAKDPK